MRRRENLISLLSLNHWEALVLKQLADEEVIHQQRIGRIFITSFHQLRTPAAPLTASM